jgi:hypothetical protein
MSAWSFRMNIFPSNIARTWVCRIRECAELGQVRTLSFDFVSLMKFISILLMMFHYSLNRQSQNSRGLQWKKSQNSHGIQCKQSQTVNQTLKVITCHCHRSGSTFLPFYTAVPCAYILLVSFRVSRVRPEGALLPLGMTSVSPSRWRAPRATATGSEGHPAVPGQAPSLMKRSSPPLIILYAVRRTNNYFSGGCRTPLHTQGWGPSSEKDPPSAAASKNVLCPRVH